MLGSYDLSAEEAMFQVSPKGDLHIPVQNFQWFTTYLPEGMEHGQVESVSHLTLLPLLMTADVKPRRTVMCANVSIISPDKRCCCLRDISPRMLLTLERKFQDFETFFLENHNMFALSDDELGWFSTI